MKINLGCGNNYKEGYINVDNFEDGRFKVDTSHDLNIFPYPFRTSSAQEIYINHVLEHLEEPRKVIREVHRILKKDSLFVLNVPHFTRGYSVHVHTRGFSIWSVLEDTKDLFEPVSVKLVWENPENFARFKFILKPFAKFWNWVLNKNLYFAERFLCYNFGGINEIRFVLRKR